MFGLWVAQRAEATAHPPTALALGPSAWPALKATNLNAGGVRLHGAAQQWHVLVKAATSTNCLGTTAGVAHWRRQRTAMPPKGGLEPCPPAPCSLGSCLHTLASQLGHLCGCKLAPRASVDSQSAQLQGGKCCSTMLPLRRSSRRPHHPTQEFTDILRWVTKVGRVSFSSVFILASWTTWWRTPLARGQGEPPTEQV